MEIRDIDAEDEELEKAGHKFGGYDLCRGSQSEGGDLNDHFCCDECGACGHPMCDEYVEEHHGKGLPEEKTPPPGLGKTKFEVVGYEDFQETHVGEMVRIVPKSYDAHTFHVERLPSGTIRIYYCGEIRRVEKE